ncbi:MAG: hypothetical protein ACRCYP_07705, partial [Alphaproteobacteria bacterium]
MPVDSSIPLSALHFKAPDMIGAQQQAAQLREHEAMARMRQMQMEAAQREQSDSVALSDLYRTHGTDREAMLRGMAQGGLGSR